jgi:hypothetical protein
MIREVLVFGICGWIFAAGQRLSGETIAWFSDANLTNLDSFGQPMDGGFVFELGVFTGGFTPNAGNVADWLDHWVSADSVTYNPGTRRFSGQHEVADNSAPFSVGAQGWVLGRRAGPSGSEWILFRAASWLWPAPNPMNPITLDWRVGTGDLVVVLGTVNAGANPFLMKSAWVTEGPPPVTWNQWQQQKLAAEPLDEPEDDPDQDGTPNLLEFVFDTEPLAANPPVATPLSVSGGHLVMTIPRRLAHQATLVVEVSENLIHWGSGPEVTEVISNGEAALVVRDLTPLDQAGSRRFMRLKASLP